MRKVVSDLKQYLSQLAGVDHPKVEVAEIKWKDTKRRFDGAEFRAIRSAFMIRVNEGAPELFRELIALLDSEITEAHNQLDTEVLAHKKLTTLIYNHQAIKTLITESGILTELVTSSMFTESKKTIKTAIAIVEKIEKLLD